MPATRSPRRCLIVERHAWETGGRQQQLQLVVATARPFFGPGNTDRSVSIRLYLPSHANTPITQHAITISREYANGTRRTNAFPEIGAAPPSFVFFEETATAGTYDVWWLEDKAIVVARFRDQPWQKGGNSQYGRGRLSVIVPAPVPHWIDDL